MCRHTLRHMLYIIWCQYMVAGYDAARHVATSSLMPNCITNAKKSVIIAAIFVRSHSKIPGLCLFFSLFTLPNSLLYIFSYLHVWYIKSWWIRENDSIKWWVKKLKQKNKQKPGIFEWLRTQIAAIIADFLACVIQASAGRILAIQPMQESAHG